MEIKPVRTTSASSSRSLKTIFKRAKIQPDESPGTWCQSVSIQVDENRTIRVLQTHPAESGRKSCPLLNAHGEKKVFFVHGVGGSADIWKHQMIFFTSRGYETVALDLLGHGKSSKPRSSESYSFDNLAKDVLQIFDLFQGKRNILVGHSYGASFVTVIASERKTAVSKVVLISGGPPSSLKPERFSLFCLPLAIFGPLKPLIVKKYRLMAFHSNSTKFNGFSLPAYALKGVMQGQNWPQGDEEFHADLLVPVVLIYGKSDRFVSLEEERWTQEVIYNSYLEVVEDAGHMVMIEKPDVVNEMILRFLNRDASTRSMVDLSQAPSSSSVPGDIPAERSGHAVGRFVNRDLLHDELSGASRTGSRAASRLSRHGSEKRTKVML